MSSAATCAPAKCVLSPEELAKFREDGFILKKGICNPALLAQIRSEADGLHERMAAQTPSNVHVSWEKPVEGRPKLIKQLMNSEHVSPGLNTLMRSDEVLDIIETLVGPDISLFHSKLLMKAALDGTVTPWHQDYAYWKKGENRPVQVNAMLAIDPATKANGCIQFVPGTHKQGLIKHDREQGVSFGVYLPGYFQPREGAVLCEMEAGDIVFFGSLVIHGSDGNYSPNHRRANTVAYTTTGDDPAHFREVLRGRGLKS